MRVCLVPLFFGAGVCSFQCCAMGWLAMWTDLRLLCIVQVGLKRLH
jgi:hypothetical protein